MSKQRRTRGVVSCVRQRHREMLFRKATERILHCSVEWSLDRRYYRFRKCLPQFKDKVKLQNCQPDDMRFEKIFVCGKRANEICVKVDNDASMQHNRRKFVAQASGIERMQLNCVKGLKICWHSEPAAHGLRIGIHDSFRLAQRYRFSSFPSTATKQLLQHRRKSESSSAGNTENVRQIKLIGLKIAAQLG